MLWETNFFGAVSFCFVFSFQIRDVQQLPVGTRSLRCQSLELRSAEIKWYCGTVHCTTSALFSVWWFLFTPSHIGQNTYKMSNILFHSILFALCHTICQQSLGTELLSGFVECLEVEEPEETDPDTQQGKGTRCRFTLTETKLPFDSHSERMCFHLIFVLLFETRLFVVRWRIDLCRSNSERYKAANSATFTSNLGPTSAQSGTLPLGLWNSQTRHKNESARSR